MKFRFVSFRFVIFLFVNFRDPGPGARGPGPEAGGRGPGPGGGARDPGPEAGAKGPGPGPWAQRVSKKQIVRKQIRKVLFVLRTSRGGVRKKRSQQVKYLFRFFCWPKVLGVSKQK